MWGNFWQYRWNTSRDRKALEAPQKPSFRQKPFAQVVVCSQSYLPVRSQSRGKLIGCMMKTGPPSQGGKTVLLCYLTLIRQLVLKMIGRIDLANSGDFSIGYEDELLPSQRNLRRSLQRCIRSTQLRKLMTAYCDRQSVELNSIAFSFAGPPDNHGELQLFAHPES